MSNKETFIEPSVAFESLRNGEFDFAAALGELVDNSIEAKATRIDINIKYDNVKGIVNQVSVIDNGYGMDSNLVGNCLQLGKTARTGIVCEHRIGRFGVGLTLGSISIGRRVEVYSRKQKNTYFTYLDLDDLKNKRLENIPSVKEVIDSNKLKKIGTMIVIKKCDRLNKDFLDQKRKHFQRDIEKLEEFLRRAYRYFIKKGLEINLNGKLMVLIDPLMVLNNETIEVMGKELSEHSGPDYENITKIILTDEIILPIVKSEEKAKINLKMSLLPEIYRKETRKGNKNAIESMNVSANEGISILREGREVFYGKIPYLIGKRGIARYEAIDRWWGLEIDFPAKLDNYFHVKYIKNRIEPDAFLKEEIRNIIKSYVQKCRDEIRRVHKENSDSRPSSTKTEIVQKVSNAEYISMEQVNQLLDNYFNTEEIKTDIPEINEDIKENNELIRKEFGNNNLVIRKKKLSSGRIFEAVKFNNKTVFYLNLNHLYVSNLLGDFQVESEVNEIEYVNKNKIIEQLYLNIIAIHKTIEKLINDDEQRELFLSTWSEILENDIKKLFDEGGDKIG